MIDGQPLACFQPLIDTATGRRLDRQIRDNALSRLHEAPSDWFLSLNISPRWINSLRPGQALPSLKQLISTA